MSNEKREKSERRIAMNNRIGFGALHSLTQRRRERVRFAGLLAMLAVLPAMAEEQEIRPEIAANSVSVSQKEDSPLVEIAYTLTGEPAIVTIAIETNTLADAAGDWVAVNGKGMEELLGEANKIVYTLDTPLKAYWKPSAEFNGNVLTRGTVRATVTAWPTNNPPNYMVVDLLPLNEQESLFPKRRYRYYATTNELPGGVEDVRYRTSKFLMRKIPAKNVVWWMGSPMRIGDEGWDTVNHVPHKVKLTEDYYAGVFELTIGQLKAADAFDKFPKTNFTDYAQSEVADLLPAERIGHYIEYLRGLNGYSKFYGYMSTFYGEDFAAEEEKRKYYQYFQRGHEVAHGSVIDILRKRTGIVNLDLPSEAQWEFAARAGSNTRLPCNMEYSQNNAYLFASIRGNQYTHNGLGVTGPMPVGSLKPNDWGLYDVLGNVSEICLDFRGVGDDLPRFKESLEPGWDTGAVTVDPYGVQDAGRNMVRGWNWREGADTEAALESEGLDRRYQYQLTSPNSKPKVRRGYIGVRLFCPVVGNVK